MNQRKKNRAAIKPINMVSIEDIKRLREATQVSMAECKAALEEAERDFDKAVEILRRRGALKAEAKKARQVGAGIVETYVHPGGRVGAILELRAETDFVARNEEFKKLAHELCLQVAAMAPVWVRPEDVPEEIIAKEKKIWEEALGIGGKPAEIREKILGGKLQSYFKEVCLLRQSYVKDETLVVEDVINNAIAKVGENILVARFARFEVS